MCDVVLAISIVIAAGVVLYYTLMIRSPSNGAAAIPETFGKILLLWPAVALVLGIVAEATLLATRRAEYPEERPAAQSMITEVIHDADADALLRTTHR